MNVSMSNLMKDVTMTVRLTGVRTARVRQWLGVRLIKLAAFVMGVGFFIEVERQEFERRDRRKSL